VVVVCGTVVRRAHRRFPAVISGPLVDYDRLGFYKQNFNDIFSLASDCVKSIQIQKPRLHKKYPQ
jgi:hypothetical protein